MSQCCDHPTWPTPPVGSIGTPGTWRTCLCDCHVSPIVLTGRQRWLECEDSDGTFESRASTESAWHACAPIGEQSGTFFKTARTHDGLPIWRWGSRDTAAEVNDGE